MDFSVDLLHTMENEMKSEMQKILKAVNVSSAAEVNETVMMKLNKNSLANFVVRLVNLAEKNMSRCKTAAGKMDTLKSEQIANQKKLLIFQQGQIDSVQETVKSELNSWADIVKKNTNQHSQSTEKSVKQALRTVNEEEKRSKNLMIYGCAEEEGENILDTVIHVYRSLEIHDRPPFVEVYRMGKNKEPGKIRPIKVELPNAGDVEFALTQARKLKTSLNHTSVFLGPDRTKEERLAHNKLVKGMKLMIEKDPNKHYFIRNNKVCSADKPLSVSPA